MRRLMVLLIALAAVGFAAAGDLEKGDRETSFRVSYSDTDLGSSGGFDLGSSKNTDLGLSYGWVLSDHHELGVTLGYSNEDIEGGDIAPDSEVDGTRFGGFYNFNFKTGGKATPYLGAVIAKLGGDLGDAYDLQYGAELGVKFYPFKHAGFSAGIGFSKLKADMSGLDDADTVNVGAGLLLKY